MVRIGGGDAFRISAAVFHPIGLGGPAGRLCARGRGADGKCQLREIAASRAHGLRYQESPHSYMRKSTVGLCCFSCPVDDGCAGARARTPETKWIFHAVGTRLRAGLARDRCQWSGTSTARASLAAELAAFSQLGLVVWWRS